jgi:hypothetical protein
MARVTAQAVVDEKRHGCAQWPQAQALSGFKKR